MAPWNSSPKVDAQIQLDNEIESKPNAHSPTYIGQEYITGAAIFSLRKNDESISYKIAVKGVVQTKTTELPAGGLQSNSRTETQTFLSATLFEGSRPAVLDNNKRHIARVPFKFNLANNHDDSSDSFRSSGHFFQQFLPSIDSKTASKHWSSNFKSGPDAQYSVTYTITATAVSDRKKIFSASRQFSWQPSIIDADPVALEDFPEEYMVRTTKAISKSSSSTSRVGMISEEPAVLALRRGSTAGETDLNLFLMLFRDGANSFGKESLPKVARLKAEMRTTTIVMDRAGTPTAHTLPGALKTGAVIKQEKSFAQDYTLPLNQWHCPDSESEVQSAQESDLARVLTLTAEDHSTTGEEVLTNALSLPFRISATRPLPPAFYSPLLSRRYAIDLALTFDDDNGTALKLRSPVQIGHET